MPTVIRPLWLLASLAACAAAQAATETPQASPAETPAPSSAAANQVVAIDHATGRLRAPTAEERQALATRANSMKKVKRVPASNAARNAFNRPATDNDALASRRSLAGGTIAIKLPESEMSALTARYDAQGKLVLSHADEAAASQEPTHE